MNQYPPLKECRPIIPDHAEFVPQLRRSNGRILRRHPIGQHCDPAVCPHPVSARVWPDRTGYVARCHDCGGHILRNGTWVTVA